MGVMWGDLPAREPLTVAQQLAEQDFYIAPIREWLGRANRFTCPLGWQSGRGMIIMRQVELNVLDYFGDEVGAGTVYDLKIHDDNSGRERTIKNISAVNAYCITPGMKNDPDQAALYALDLVDRRYYLGQKPIGASYNVRKAPNGDYVDETLDSDPITGDPIHWTWDSMGEDLWNNLNFTDNPWPGWPFTPDGEPTSWHFWQMPGIQALDIVARRLGCALRWDPYADFFDIVQLGVADPDFTDSVNTLDAQLYRIWDEQWIEPIAPRTPEKVRVLFRRLLAEADGNPYYVVDQLYPDVEWSAEAEPGSKVLVIDDLIYDGGNAAACNMRATERVNDYMRMHQNSWPRMHRQYRGALLASDRFIGPLCWQLSWEDVGRGVYTSIDSGPPESIDWTQVLHGVGELVTEAQCVGGDIQETLLNVWWGKPIRFGV